MACLLSGETPLDKERPHPSQSTPVSHYKSQHNKRDDKQHNAHKASWETQSPAMLLMGTLV